MTRTYCMIKLLRHGALTFRECVVITGWRQDRVRQTLRRLKEVGRVKSVKGWPRRYSLSGGQCDVSGVQ
jgi:sugar-specific transcriptional regulator TrmB